MITEYFISLYINVTNQKVIWLLVVNRRIQHTDGGQDISGKTKEETVSIYSTHSRQNVK